jgi:hypothetical protein
MKHTSKNCIHPPGSGHQEKIWEKALKLKKKKRNQEDAKRIIKKEWDDYHKDVGPAVDRAVERVFSSNLKKDKGKKPWPKGDKNKIKAVAEKKPYSLEELRKESPHKESKLKVIPRWGILQLLFPKGSLVCLGESVKSWSTKKLEEFCCSDENLPFIVPRTMSDEFGIKQGGEISTRCNHNTGPERFVVIEFDGMEENVQISMINHLRKFLPLVLVLHSGGKSFHAWFNGCDAREERVLAFRRHAASLGADRAVFTKSQMIRMPNQIRGENGKLQELHYFDPGKLPTTSNGAPAINFDNYPFGPEEDLAKKNAVKVPRIESWDEFKENCPPEPVELIEGFLHKGCKGALGGQSKAGKSHLAMQLADAVSKGENFLGMPTRVAEVLYLSLELPPFSLEKTFKRLKSKTVASIEVDHLHIANGRGNWSGIESLDAMVDGIIDKGIELIVIDPLYKVEDIDENDQAAVKKVLRVFDDITNKTGAALLYVHHFTKGKSTDKNTIDLLAGSGVLARDYDSFLSLTESKEGKFEAKFILRNHPPKAAIPLKEDYPLKVVDESAIGGNGGKLEVPTKAGRTKYSTAELVSLFEEGEELNSKELQNRAEGALDVKRSTFHELLQKAKEEGLLSSRKVGNRKFYYLPPVSSE